MEIRPLIDHSTENTRNYFKEKYNVSTENFCVAGGVHFIHDLMSQQGENFQKIFNKAFLIKSYADEDRFVDRRAIFDTGVVLQTDNVFYSVFFGRYEGRLVHKSPDIKTMMEDFKKNKPGPWPDGEIVESLFEQVKFPIIRDYRNPYDKIQEENDSSTFKNEILYLDAIVRRNNKVELKQYCETFSKNQ